MAICLARGTVSHGIEQKCAKNLTSQKNEGNSRFTDLGLMGSELTCSGMGSSSFDP